MKEKDYKKNVALYKIYKAFAYDLVFYYSIYILYYTITKKLSVSEVMYICAAFSFFSFLWQIPTNFIVSKIGLKKAMIIGNILVAFEMTGYIFSNKMIGFMFFDFFGALGWALKGISESSILYSSLKRIGKKEKFSKYEGKALSYYYYYEAISSLLAGFLFVINNYIPIILCVTDILISVILSFKFTEIENQDEENNESMKYTVKQLLSIFNLKRSSAILIFTLIFAGIISVGKKMFNSILIDLNLPEQYIAVIVSFVTIFTGVGSKFSYKFERGAKNKTLTIHSYLLIISLFFVGFIGYINKLDMATLSLYMIAVVIMCLVIGSYTVAIKKYVLNFTTHNVREKITSLYYFCKYIGETVFLLINGVILEHFNNSISTMIFSLLAGLICLTCLKYMDGKVGLQPDEYSNKEIYR